MPQDGRSDHGRAASTGGTVNRGDRVELVAVTAGDERFGLTAGDRGTIEFTDSLGTVHVRWDSGKRVGIIGRAGSDPQHTGCQLTRMLACSTGKRVTPLPAFRMGLAVRAVFSWGSGGACQSDGSVVPPDPVPVFERAVAADVGEASGPHDIRSGLPGVARRCRCPGPGPSAGSHGGTLGPLRL